MLMKRKEYAVGREKIELSVHRIIEPSKTNPEVSRKSQITNRQSPDEPMARSKPRNYLSYKGN
jgi:hypothetical protein